MDVAFVWNPPNCVGPWAKWRPPATLVDVPGTGFPFVSNVVPLVSVVLGAAYTVMNGSPLLKVAPLNTLATCDLSSWKNQRKDSPDFALGSIGFTVVNVKVEARHAVAILLVVSLLLTKPAGVR